MGYEKTGSLHFVVLKSGGAVGRKLEVQEPFCVQNIKTCPCLRIMPNTQKKRELNQEIKL